MPAAGVFVSAMKEQHGARGALRQPGAIEQRDAIPRLKRVLGGLHVAIVCGLSAMTARSRSAATARAPSLSEAKPVYVRGVPIRSVSLRGRGIVLPFGQASNPPQRKQGTTGMSRPARS